MHVCDPNSAFFGYMGIVASCVFANIGAAYGTAKSGVGICSVGVMRPDLMMKSLLPIIMAGVLVKPVDLYSSYQGYTHLAAGLVVGLSSLAAGLSIGIVGDAGVRANAQQNRLFIGVLLILVFSETLALY
ncbi:V-type proton ATPase 16 kDa proteolipid subunit, putative, partial [Hepatocystis sp. ex Piliocolobus tephrosceles]